MECILVKHWAEDWTAEKSKHNIKRKEYRLSDSYMHLRDSVCVQNPLFALVEPWCDYLKSLRFLEGCIRVSS